MKDWPKVRLRTRGRTIDWVVDSGIINGKRHREFKKTKAEALARAEEIRKEHERMGDYAFQLGTEQRMDAAKAVMMLSGRRCSLIDAVQYYLDHHPAIETPTMGAMQVMMLEAKEAKGLRNSSLQSIRSVPKPFIDRYASIPVNEITRANVEGFISERSDLSPVSKNNILRYLEGFFGFAINHGYIKDNPVTGIERAKIRLGVREFMPVEDVIKVLNAAPENMVAKLAIGFFAGIRDAELDRLDWAKIHFDGFITITADNSKTGVARHVNIRPNLGKWLMGRVREEGPISNLKNGQFSHERKKLCKKLGIYWPNNAMRHSYATYHIAMWQDAAQTAFQLGHTSGPQLLYRHYKGLTTQEEAKKYWAIEPETREAT
jgi:integrase